ncbi:MAG: DUF971 domain-containing protein [Hyphomicrobiales bacterium]
MNLTTEETWPEELRLARDGGMLTVVWSGGRVDSLDAEYLRVESPSAEVKGHGPGQEKIVPGKRRVRIERLEPVGSYAVRLLFDDGHSTGIYTWPYLATLAQTHTETWARYLDALTAQGLSRD